MNIARLQTNLEAEGFSFRFFPSAAQARDYLVQQLQGKTIGMGGSMTLEVLDLYPRLCETSTVFWHWKTPGPETLQQAASAQVYLTSLNAIAETGELINIDGAGNRISAATAAREAVYFIVGRNKVEASFPKALWRARNIAAPMNARRLQRSTPCAVGDTLKCYDCQSPQRICRGLSVWWRPMLHIPRCEVVLIDEDLGF